METHKVHFWRQPLGLSIEGLPFLLGGVHCSPPKLSGWVNQAHHCLLDALLPSVFPCTSQKITLFLLYTAGRHDGTESLAIMLVSNVSFKSSLGTLENK